MNKPTEQSQEQKQQQREDQQAQQELHNSRQQADLDKGAARQNDGLQPRQGGDKGPRGQ